MASVAIIDYGSSNLRSAAKAFERSVRELGRDDLVRVTSDPDEVARADRIVLPGVGAYADCRAGLASVQGMEDALEEAVVKSGRPFLGICVGMQLMASAGYEFEVTEGLDWVPGGVRRINPAPDEAGLARKVPHMGWNALRVEAADHPILDGLLDGDHAYFVHSYAIEPERAEHRLASVDYGGPIAAMIGRDNRVGTQFHPEKSQRVGLALIRNFLNWRP